MTDIYIALDPGVATGIAQHRPVYPEDFKAWERDQGTTCHWLDKRLYELVTENEEEVEVVCESYTISGQTTKKTRQYASLEIIGTARYLCQKYDVPFVLQTPAEAKRFATDARLKGGGFWTPTKGGHANDAARHMFVRLTKRGLLNIQEIDNAEG